MKSPFLHRTKEKWFLATNDLYIGNPPYIDWLTLLPKVGGTKHQRSYLVKSVQGLMEAMAKIPRTNTSSWVLSGILAHGTIQNWFYTIRRFVRWMVRQDIWLFSQLTAIELEAYIENSAKREDASGPVALATWHHRTGVLQAMWNLRSEYVGSLRIDPAKLTLATSRKFRQPSSWKALDESVGMPLIGDSVDWIEKFGPLVEETLKDYWNYRSKEVGLTAGEITQRLSKWYQKMEKDPRWIKMRQFLKMPNALTFHVIRRAYGMSKGACANVILFTVGMRSSELCRLDIDCLRVEKDSLGNQVTRIYGVAAKQGGRRRHWIVCDQVVKAVNHIKNITSVARKSTGNQGLFITGITDNFLRPGCRVTRMNHYGLCRVLRLFAKAPLRIRKISRLHPHMARKSFARYVILRNKNALGPMAQHYGHVRREVTDGSYVGSDMTLASMLEEESRRDLARGLMDLITTDSIGGKAGAALVRIRQEAMKFRGKKALTRFVEKLIADGVQLAPCDWGYCVYSKFFSACDGDDQGPDESRRSPDVCSGCANFSVTKVHQPWWEKRLQRDDEFLSRIGINGQSNAVVSARRANSAAILLKLVRSDESPRLEKS